MKYRIYLWHEGDSGIYDLIIPCSKKYAGLQSEFLNIDYVWRGIEFASKKEAISGWTLLGRKSKLVTPEEFFSVKVLEKYNL